MSWWEDVGSLSKLANSLKSYLQTWIDGIAKYWVKKLAYTVSEVNNLLDDAYDYVEDWADYLQEYADTIGEDLWDEASLIWKRIGDIPVLTKEDIITMLRTTFEGLKEYAEELVSDAFEIADDLISELSRRTDNVEDWISASSDWFIAQIAKKKDVLILLLAENIESVLDRVFEKGEK